MKYLIKIFSIFCVLTIMFTAGSCGIKETPAAETTDGAEQTPRKIYARYNNREDFSGEQGYKNWYYLTARDSLDDTQYMIWDSEMCTWRAKDPNCLVEANIAHPAQLDQVIRAWKAPADGAISIRTVVQRRPVNRNGVGQDGCYVYIATGDDDIVIERIIDSTDLAFHDLNADITIKKGQFVYFVLNCNGNYTFDQTYWNITITYGEN
ncbi:MAG: hypothetical protein IJR61_07265 [Clostridia bacterium]|nr:hypothetical protein [Clostridia bacterium]